MAPRAKKADAAAATAQGPAKAQRPAKPPKPAKPERPPKPAKPEKPPKPPRTIEKAGDGYRSPDGRFTVEGTPGAWYVADTASPSPLGTPTIVGPFRTLAEVKAAVEAARSA